MLRVIFLRAIEAEGKLQQQFKYIVGIEMLLVAQVLTEESLRFKLGQGTQAAYDAIRRQMLIAGFATTITFTILCFRCIIHLYV